MGSLFGGGKKTERTTPDPAGPEERALQAEALITAQIRNQLLREQIEAQTRTFAQLGGALELGIAGTLEEEARFGILAGETIGPSAVDTDTGADIQTFLAKPPASSQIGAPGAPGAAPANATEVESLQRELTQLRIDAKVQNENLTEEGLPGGVSFPTQRRINEITAQIAALKAPAPTPAAEPADQGVIDRLKQSILQIASTEAKTPAGEGIRQQLLQKQLDLIEKGGRATPEDIADIKRAADAASEEGAIAIRHFADRLLIDIRDVLTPARGLRPQDTPIREEGGRVGAEATRQFGELQARLRTVQAQQELTLPLARQGFTAELTGFQQNLAQAAREFQIGLRQQAFDNRLRLAATESAAFGTLLGTPGVNVDFPRGTTTTTTGGGDIAGGIGKLLIGTALAFGTGGASAAAGTTAGSFLPFALA